MPAPMLIIPPEDIKICEKCGGRMLFSQIINEWVCENNCDLRKNKERSRK